MKNNKKIGYIENGIVIDHIPHGKVWEVINILDINKKPVGRISVGDGYQTSKKKEKKGILKIEDFCLNGHNLDKVALIAPDATISIIKEGEVSNKRKAEIPGKLEGLIYCVNPNCITNDAAEKETSIIYYKNNLFTCHYCNHNFSRDEAKLI